MGWYRRDGADLILEVRIQPRASQDAFGEVLGDTLKLRITAPPVDGKANTHLVGWLAREFGVAKGQVRIEAGETGRRKRLRIESPRRLPPELALE